MNALLAKIAQDLNLAYTPGQKGGSHAACLGAYELVDRPIQLDIARKIDPRQMNAVADFRVDPLGYLLGAECVFNRGKLASDLATCPVADRHRLLDAARWSDYHFHLAKPHLELLTATCRVNGVTGGTSFANDSTLVHRVRQQIYHLRLSPSDGNRNPIYPLGEAPKTYWRRKASDGLSFITKFRLNQNWEEPKIGRKQNPSKTSGNVVLTARQPSPYEQRIAAVNWVRGVEAEESEKRLEALNRANDAVPRRGAPRRLPPLALSAMPPHAHLSEAHLDLIVRAARKEWRENSGALLSLVQITACLAIEHIPELKIRRNAACYYLGTPCPALALDGEMTAELHYAAGEIFWRRVPSEIGVALEKAVVETPHEVLALEHEMWLKARGGSRAKLNYALRWNAPVYWDSTWLLPEFGLNVLTETDGKLRAPGYRSYAVWDPSLQEARHLMLLGRLGVPTAADPGVAQIERCGSRHCITVPEATALFWVRADLIRAAASSLPADYGALASLSNAIAATTRLLEILLTFQRNYPAAAPAIIRGSDRWRLADRSQLVREKLRPRPVFYTKDLEATLVEVSHIFFGVIEHLEGLGHIVTRPVSSGGWTRAYGFLPVSCSGRIIQVSEPRISLIAEGLLNHPSTERFGRVHPNAFRCLSYYILCRDKEIERDLLAFHDHFPEGGAGAFDPRRAEPIMQTEIRAAAADKILASLQSLAA